MRRRRRHKIIYLFVIVFTICGSFYISSKGDLTISRHEKRNSEPEEDEDLPIIYMITPTYPRPEQLPELTRLSQTLLHVKNLVWIVIEDAPKPSASVVELLYRSKVKSVYLRAPMPEKYKLMEEFNKKPRGVSNRNAGIEWIRKNAKSGVVFFGDDDNTYHLKLFEEIRWTQKISMFPVGLLKRGTTGINTPIVKHGKVVAFNASWRGPRRFKVNMAEFAFTVQVLLEHPKATMPYLSGWEEDKFIKLLGVQVADIEPKAQNCTKVFVWHTQTLKSERVSQTVMQLDPKFEDSNIIVIKKHMWTVEEGNKCF